MIKKILSVALVLALLLCLCSCSSAKNLEGTYKVVKVKFAGTTYTTEEWEEYFQHGSYLSSSELTIISDGSAITSAGTELYWDKTGNKIKFYTLTSELSEELGENVEFNGKTHPIVPESKKKIDDEAKISNGKLLFGEGSSSIIFKKIAN